MKKEPVVIERIFNAPAEDVWKVITDKDELSRWQFNVSEFKPEVGFEFQFRAGVEGRSYLHICKITEVIPEKRLVYSWQFDGYEGISQVSFDLFKDGSKTKMLLIHSGIEKFSPPNPDFSIKNFNEGWTDILDTHIRESLKTMSFMNSAA